MNKLLNLIVVMVFTITSGIFDLNLVGVRAAES